MKPVRKGCWARQMAE